MDSGLKNLMLVLPPYALGCFITALACGWSPVQYGSTLLAKGRAGQAVNEYIAAHPVRKLQIGAGPNSLKGWLNTDIEPSKRSSISGRDRTLPDTSEFIRLHICRAAP